MTRPLLIRGMLVGLVAGLLAFGVAALLGEPQVQHAIDFEDALAPAAAPGDPVEAELVSRGLQRSLGLLTGTLLMGAALGGIVALTFAWAYGRIGAMSPRLTALMLAGAGLVCVVLVPFTKYPASPPTVGNDDTIGQRTLLYVVMVAIAILTAIAAGRIRRATIPRLGAWNATLAAIAIFLVVIAAAQLALPAVHETPAGFPADVLYRFRLASLGISAVLWTTIGLGFGAVAQRLLVRPVPARADTAHATH